MSKRDTRVFAVRAKDPLSVDAIARSRDEIVDSAITAGKIASSERSVYRESLDANEAATVKVLARLHPSPWFAARQETAVEDLAWPGPPVAAAKVVPDGRPEADLSVAGFEASVARGAR